MSESTFRYWWQCHGPWVEPANQRRGGESGVQYLHVEGDGVPGLYCKRQTGHLYRSLRYPLGRPTVIREAEAYRAWQALGIPLPVLRYAGARREQGQWRALLVTEALTGFISLDQWYEQAPRAEPERHAMLHDLATILARLHTAGWQHGCLYAKHVFVNVGHGRPRVALIDLEKSRRRFRRATASWRDLDQFGRHRGAMPERDWAWFLEQYRRAWDYSTKAAASRTRVSTTSIKAPAVSPVKPPSR